MGVPATEHASLNGKTCLFPPKAYVLLRPLRFHFSPPSGGAELPLGGPVSPSRCLPPAAAHFGVKGLPFRVEPALHG